MKNLLHKIRLMLLGVFIAIGANAIAQVGSGVGVSTPPVGNDPTFDSLTIGSSTATVTTPFEVLANVNTTFTQEIDNDSNGTLNAARITITSGDASVALFSGGTGRTTPIITGGPTGASGVLRMLGVHPLVFGTGNTERMRIAGTGDVTLSNDLVVQGTKGLRLDVASHPRIIFDDSDAAVDEKIWDVLFSVSGMTFRTLTDIEGTPVTFMTVTRTGTTVDTVNLAATDVQVRGANIRETSTFTITLDSGCTTNPTGTAVYSRNADSVVLDIPFVICTSNATTKIFLADLPVSIRPTVNQLVVCRIQDNATNQFGVCSLNTNGDIQLGVGAGFLAFTASGSAGVLDNSVAYLLN